jgi:hypothetical protein
MDLRSPQPSMTSERSVTPAGDNPTDKPPTTYPYPAESDSEEDYAEETAVMKMMGLV